MVILVDIDGVLANFAKSLYSLAYMVTGKIFREKDLSSWDLNQNFSPEEEAAVWGVLTETKGFVLDIDPYEYTAQFLHELRTLGTVVAVTSPQFTPYWMYERGLWLMEHGFTKETIILADSKYHTQGDVFIDDKPSNVDSWVEANPKGLGFFLAKPYTRHIPTKGIALESWDEIVDRILEHRADKRAK